MSKAKISIRFFNDREVRAIWDEVDARWWFSVLDIVAVLTNQDDYAKTRNYWKYLKAKLKNENSEVLSATTQLKLLACRFSAAFTSIGTIFYYCSFHIQTILFYPAIHKYIFSNVFT